jgi:NTP pyrophosphatase (non-canonical NTP hydrolase)
MGSWPDKDRLELIFALREQFMHALNEHKPGAYPAWPVDMSEKGSQQAIRDAALRGVEEVFEAMQHCRNWKPHRNVEDRSFDRDKFVEEMVDAFNYFFSLLIMAGVDSQELFRAFDKKDRIIHERLQSGY